MCSLGATSVHRYKHTYKNNGLMYHNSKLQQDRIGKDILVASTQLHFTSTTKHDCI